MKLFPANPPPGPSRPGFWRSPLRGKWLTSALGSMLFPIILLIGLTGFLSHAAYNPDLGTNAIVPVTRDLDLFVFDWPTSPSWLYARRLAALLAIGLVHAVLLWPGDVLVVYAVLGFGVLAIRKLPERAVVALLAACLVFPAASDALRPVLLSLQTETVAAFEYEEFRATNDAGFGHGSFLDAVRETARVFAWGYSSPLGLFSYVAFYVQMATGILAGFVVGRRRWPQRLRGLGDASARWHRVALATVLLAGATWLVVAGRMPLSNYLLQTLMASAVFYGWGLGWWGRAGPALETLLAIALFLLVQLPLSALWLRRFRYGPVEYLWRRVTYGRRAR